MFGLLSSSAALRALRATRIQRSLSPKFLTPCLSTCSKGGDHKGAQDQTALVTEAEVRHLAGLACLDLEKAGGASKMREELNAMLKFIAVMDAVDTECVDPMWTPLEPDFSAPMRDDVAKPSGPCLLQLAGKTKPPYYLVPKRAVTSVNS